MSDAGVRGAPLAMLDAIDFAEELGMMWIDEVERRRATVREALAGGLTIEGSLMHARMHG